MNTVEDYTPGTRVETGDDWKGVVVFNNFTKQYGDGYKEDDWKEIGNGYMVLFDKIGLVFYPECDSEMTIVK
jgi:hypothetical protein